MSYVSARALPAQLHLQQLLAKIGTWLVLKDFWSSWDQYQTHQWKAISAEYANMSPKMLLPACNWAKKGFLGSCPSAGSAAAHTVLPGKTFVTF